ncbi:hypothetical protein OIU77_001188, partial [Salix suchowensis]
MAWGLANSKQPFLWVVRPGSVHGSEQVESLPDGFRAIVGEQPSFGDQKVTARYVSQVWRVGLHLEDELERGEIESAIRRLMADKEGDEMRQRAMNLKEKAELCIRTGGSSSNSLN